MIDNAPTHGVLDKKVLAVITRLVSSEEIGDPDAVGYRNGAGAKVLDDPDAEYLDEQSNSTR